MKKKFTMTESNINLLLAIAGVAIFLVAYLLGYNNLSAKNAELDTQIAERGAYLEQLKVYLENIQTYEAGIIESENTINTCLKRLPTGIKPEDFLLYMVDLHGAQNLKLPSVSVSGEEVVSDFTTMVDGHAVNMTGMRVGATTSTTMTYAQLKKYVSDIYDTNKPVTFLNSITISGSGDSNELACSISLSKYYVTYEGSVYEPYPAPSVPMGTDNPFKTDVKLKVEQ